MKRHWGTLQHCAPSPPSGLPRCRQLSGDRLPRILHTARAREVAEEAERRRRIALRRYKHCGTRGADVWEAGNVSYRFECFLHISFLKVLLSLGALVTALARIISAKGGRAYSRVENRVQEKGTRCNCVQLQGVSPQSMIWTLAPFILTCLGGWPSMWSTPFSEAWMV